MVGWTDIDILCTVSGTPEYEVRLGQIGSRISQLGFFNSELGLKDVRPASGGQLSSTSDLGNSKSL